MLESAITMARVISQKLTELHALPVEPETIIERCTPAGAPFYRKRTRGTRLRDFARLSQESRELVNFIAFGPAVSNTAAQIQGETSASRYFQQFSDMAELPVVPESDEWKFDPPGKVISRTRIRGLNVRRLVALSRSFREACTTAQH